MRPCPHSLFKSDYIIGANHCECRNRTSARQVSLALPLRVIIFTLPRIPSSTRLVVPVVELDALGVGGRLPLPPRGPIDMAAHENHEHA